MPYTAYDWQQTLAEKADYAEDRLRRGSPVVALSLPEGILLLSLRRGQAKIYEIYDRLALGALGTPADLEAVRQLAVDFAHAEGFQRSPADVSIQRVVGFAISPVCKRAFSDPLRLPLVLRAVFAQLGEAPEDDLFFVLSYDGEFSREAGRVGLAGSEAAQERMRQVLEETELPGLEAALPLALEAWAMGYGQDEDAASVRLPSPEQRRELLGKALSEGFQVEAALLERHTTRERRYRPLRAEELAPFLPQVKS